MFGFLKRRKPQQSLAKKAEPVKAAPRDGDPGFDGVGFALGYATGVPLSPSQGISMGAVVGSMLHTSNSAASMPTADAGTTSAPDSASSSPSFSSDSGSGSFSSDGGGSFGGSDSGGGGGW